jgi:multidrug efflux pump subunit AcrB
LVAHVALTALALGMFVAFTFFPQRCRLLLIAAHDRWPVMWRLNPLPGMIQSRGYNVIIIVAGLVAGGVAAFLGDALVRRLSLGR